MSRARPHQHSPWHAFAHFNPRAREGLTVFSRRSMLEAGLAGLAGLSLPLLLRLRSQATWDVKPDIPSEVRGPFADIRTRFLGVQITVNTPTLGPSR